MLAWHFINHYHSLKLRFNPSRPHPFSFPLWGESHRALLKAVSFNRSVKFSEARARRLYL